MRLSPDKIEYQVEYPSVDKTVCTVKQQKKLKDGTISKRVQGRITLPTDWIGRDMLVLLLESIQDSDEIKGVSDDGYQFFGIRRGIAKLHNATRAEYGMMYLPGDWCGKKVRCYLLSNSEQFAA